MNTPIMPMISKPLITYPKAVYNMSVMKSNMVYKFDFIYAKI